MLFGKLSSFVKYSLYHAYNVQVIMDVSYGRYQIVTLKSVMLHGAEELATNLTKHDLAHHLFANDTQGFSIAYPLTFRSWCRI